MTVSLLELHIETAHSLVVGSGMCAPFQRNSYPCSFSQVTGGLPRGLLQVQVIKNCKQSTEIDYLFIKYALF